MDNVLTGKTALVTGATTGLGRAIAELLGAAGASVAVNYANNEERANRMWSDWKAAGWKGMLLRGDVTDEVAVGHMVEQISKTLGSIDILVLNATCDQPQMPIEEYTWQHYERMIAFFIKSPYLLTRACLPAMKQKKWGRIINIGSEVFNRGVPNFSAYVAAKGAQTGFNRSMANELAPFGITMNLVAPGWIPVERHANDPAEAKEGYHRLIPAGRWGVPKDVADAVLYFASPASGFVTGQYLCVNGGMTPM